MKYAFGFLVLALAVAAGCERRTVVVIEPPPPLAASRAAPPARPPAAQVRVVVAKAPKPACHTIIGDTLKFAVLIVSDVVGIFVPVEEGRNEILRTRMVEGW